MGVVGCIHFALHTTAKARKTQLGVAYEKKGKRTIGQRTKASARAKLKVPSVECAGEGESKGVLPWRLA